MSLGSENPELLDEAFQDALVARIVRIKPWHTATDEERMRDEIKYSLSEMSCPTKDDPGAYQIYQYLMDLPGVGEDALDRFHEHWRYDP